MATIVDYEALDELLDEMDLVAKQREAAGSHQVQGESQRHYKRHPFRVACKVHFFSSELHTVIHLEGRTRNLSRNGVGLLVRRVFSPNEPIEIEIHLSTRPVTYMAGLVRFCRYAGRGYHEIGVTLHAAGSQPVFSQNPILALKTMHWLKRS